MVNFYVKINEISFSNFGKKNTSIFLTKSILTDILETLAPKYTTRTFLYNF